MFKKDISKYTLDKETEERTANLLDTVQKLQNEIEERRKVEDAIRKSEERFRRMVEYIPDAMFLIDKTGRIKDVNKRACDILEYSRDELLGIPMEDVEEEFFIYPEQWKELKKNDPVIIESSQKRKDGSSFPAEIHIWLFDYEGEEHVLALVRDITIRKKDQEERAKFKEQQSYEQKIKSIGTLAGGIAHNFNNILMGIQGNTSLMLFNKSPDDEDYYRLLNIQKLVENGAELTAQLIEYAREGTYHVIPTDLNVIIKESMDIFDSSKTGITFEYDELEKPASINVDKTQIRQAIINILNNSAEAMPDGGTIFIKTSNISNHEMTGKRYTPLPGKYVKLSISDNGAGMDFKTIERAFEPFYTTKGLASRTGLGLASTYGIIKGHGGYIDIDSRKGDGTEVTIFFPATQKKLQDDIKSPLDIEPGCGTILLIDDEEILLDTGKQLLEKIGYTVFTAESGKKAFSLYEKHMYEIDLVLLDLIMPEMNGDKVFERLREINPDVKVLLSTGYNIDEEVKELLKKGCRGYIQKPFNIKELSAEISELIRNS